MSRQQAQAAMQRAPGRRPAHRADQLRADLRDVASSTSSRPASPPPARRRSSPAARPRAPRRPRPPRAARRTTSVSPRCSARSSAGRPRRCRLRWRRPARSSAAPSSASSARKREREVKRDPDPRAAPWLRRRARSRSPSSTSGASSASSTPAFSKLVGYQEHEFLEGGVAVGARPRRLQGADRGARDDQDRRDRVGPVPVVLHALTGPDGRRSTASCRWSATTTASPFRCCSRPTSADPAGSRRVRRPGPPQCLSSTCRVATRQTL